MCTGQWTERLDELHQAFHTGKPFEHVVIHDFFSEQAIKDILEEFPDPTNKQYDWKHYDNPIEQKYALNNYGDSLPRIQKVFETLQSPDMVRCLKHITGIGDLEADPHLHGAGLHAYPRNGKLDMHLDYNIHPISGKERRVNLIIYLNDDWKEEYGGHLQLWNEDLSECTKITAPHVNTAVLFRTSDISFHGLPKPIQCPETKYRKSIAVYYVSPVALASDPDNVRLKAEFFPLPGQPVCDQLRKLYNIRKNTLITQDHLSEWPNWRSCGDGYW